MVANNMTYKDVFKMIASRITDIDDNDDLCQLFNENFAAEKEHLGNNNGEFVLTVGDD